MTSRKEEVTCIICPNGCKIQVELKENDEVEVRGNACPEGKEYAIQEVKSPSRIIMSVLECEDCDIPTVSVKTDGPIPKEIIPEVMKRLSEITVENPVNVGDLILEDIAGTGVNVIATRPSQLRAETLKN